MNLKEKKKLYEAINNANNEAINAIIVVINNEEYFDKASILSGFDKLKPSILNKINKSLEEYNFSNTINFKVIEEDKQILQFLFDIC